jgi:phosphatidate cytidylyltransferase
VKSRLSRPAITADHFFMKLRVMTALPLALIVAGLIWWAPRWLFLLVLIAAVEISLFEYFRLSRAAGFQSVPAVAYLAGAALCVAQTAGASESGEVVLAVLFLSVLLAMVGALARGSSLKDYFGSAAATVLGILYLGLTLSWLFPLRFALSFDGRAMTLFLFVVIWAGDAFALLIGRWIGRHPLVPRISPKKTVEGALAGLAGSLAVGGLCWLWFWQTEGFKTVMLVAAVAAVAGQVGDLVESALKRAADLKDSGGLLPGHGGLLDRIDSLVFVPPALWLVMALRGFWG